MKNIVVLDNLNTHFAKSFYEILSKTEADKLLERIEWQFSTEDARIKLRRLYPTILTLHDTRLSFA